MSNPQNLMGKLAVGMWGTEVAKPAAEQNPRIIGEVVGYSVNPMYLIQSPSGEKIWWNEQLVRLATEGDFVMNIENHCFQERAHKPHDWQGGRCLGQGIDPESGKVNTERDDHRNKPVIEGYGDVVTGGPVPMPEKPGRYTQIVNEPATVEFNAPAILDARQAYGDRVTNMAEQAEMINAYLSGRKVQAIDVPIIFILVKAHRLGKMPDYADNYDDIEGYLKIAREVVGEDMIEASTAREYAQVKRERNGGHGNPYRNAERDAEAEAMEAHHRRG